LVGGCGDNDTGVQVPELEVTTSTSGTDLDPDGYSVSIDGDPGRAIGITDTLDISDLTEGDHQVSLGGVVENCTVQGDNPRTVHIVSGSTTQAEFLVVCGPPGGAVTVTTATTGDQPDPDGYGVSVDDGAAVPAALNETVTIAQLAPGSHQVALTGIADNCRLQEDNPQTVTVVVGETTAVAFTLRCPVATVSRWSPQTSGTRFPLVDLWGFSGSDVFTVGQSDLTFESVILHYDGTGWSSQLDRKDIVLNAVWGSSPTDVYAVGFDAFATNPELILHFDGQQWRKMSVPPTDPDVQVFFESIWGSSASDIFVVGSVFDGFFELTLIFHFDGTDWRRMQVSDRVLPALTDVWGSSPSDVYAVGQVDEDFPSRGVILHFNGTSWSPVLQRENFAPTSVWGSSANDVFVAGFQVEETNDGDFRVFGRILHNDGTGWVGEPLPPGVGVLHEIWGSSAHDVFAVGDNGVIVHFDGTTWTSVKPTGRTLIGVWGFSPGDVFAVGEAGTILHGTP
jgi:hypothetical protein